MDSIKMNISTEDDMKKTFEKLNEQEKLLIKQLDSYVSRQYQLESKFNGIIKAIPKLQDIYNDANELSEKVHQTAAIAESVSEKVRRLDITRCRVSECQQRVHDLLDLQLCSEGVQTALKNEDYEKAAAHVHRFLSIDQSVLKQTADDVAHDHTTVDNSFTLLEEVAEQLRMVVAKKFKEAIADEDLAVIERFFKIYPLLNMHEEGLKEYSLYLSSKLRQTSEKNLKMALDAALYDKKPNVIFADTITLLLEGTARIIETHQPLVDTYYGHDKLLIFLSYLQQECDKQANKIVTEFINFRSIKTKLRQVNDYNTTKTTEKIDPKSLDVLLGELTIMHYKVDLYFKFVKRKLSSEENESPELLQKIVNLTKNCDLSHRMQEVLGYYIQLERYFTEESVLKAIAMDSLSDDSHVSSMVDDVFFILRKSIRRAATSGSVEAVCSVINNIRTLMETKYCPVLKRQLEQGYSTNYLDVAQAYTSVRLQVSDPEVKSKLFLAYINNADITLEYLQTLKTNVSEEITRAFPLLNNKDKEKVSICLTELVSSTSVVTTSIIEYGMKQLKESAIKPRISSWFASFTEISHELTDDEFNSYEANEPFIRKLIVKIDEFLSSFKEQLTPNNYDSLINLLTLEITRYFEKVILKSRFNRLGGLVLDKEIRALVSFLTSTTSWSVRDKFSKLTQISTLLNLEKLSEISEWEGTSSVDKLQASEVKKILLLRTDFSKDEVDSIRL